MERKRKEEKVKTAVALAYEAGDVAPKILATGKGELAERIIEKGKAGNVPLYKDNSPSLKSEIRYRRNSMTW